MADTKKTTKRSAKPSIEEKPIAEKQNTVSINVVDTNGKSAGSVSVASEIFAADINESLMAQAVRVYLTNQHQGTAHAKTRGEVNATTKKAYRQKGTGRARHGAMSAPTYVGGGKAHGPQPFATRLALPKKMRRKALFSALTMQLQNNNIIVVDGLQKIEPKTKHMVNTLATLVKTDAKKQPSILFIVPKTEATVIKSARNIPHVTLDQAANLHTYAVLHAKKVLFTKAAIESLQSVFLGKSA